MKPVIIIAIAVSFLFIPISNVSAFEPDLYDGFFISYGKCNVVVDADTEMFRIMLSKLVKEESEGLFCNLLENSKFEYDHITSKEIVTKKIKFGTEEPVRFFTTIDDERFDIVLGKNWKQGDSINQKFGQISKLNHVGLNTIEINGKMLDVYEFESEVYAEDSGNIAEFKATTQYDVSSGFLISVHYKIAIASLFIGGASYTLDLQANDISEKPLLANILDTESLKGGGCLIATATYGSELAPQVQQLRELRDNKLLQTEVGTSFMESFNDFYYSFSPIIADLERENPVFKEMVKIAITPMITSLSILNYVDMDSEVEVLGYGISLIILNGMMYFGIPILAIMMFRKY